MVKPRVKFISQLAVPGHFPDDTYAAAPGRDNEVVWVDLILGKAGVREKIEYSGLRVTHGDALPDFNDADAFIIGGSYHNVGDQYPFQLALIDWIKSARKTDKPVFGICGGHQLMSAAFGGEISTVETGPMSASLPINLTHAGEGHFLFDDMEDDLRFHFGNFEHVLKAPTGTTVLATRPEMPAAVIDYGQNWFSCQYHPEAHHEIFASAWADKHPEFMDNYVELPLAPLMLRNFLTGTGVLAV